MSTRTVETSPRQEGAGDGVARSDLRRYSEEEVGEILQRTTGLERRRQLERPSLSLTEIEAIARESGLDATLVRQAARDLENERSAKSATSWAGAPLRRTSERVVNGELSTEQAERVAAELLEATRGARRASGSPNAGAVRRSDSMTRFDGGRSHTSRGLEIDQSSTLACAALGWCL